MKVNLIKFDCKWSILWTRFGFTTRSISWHISINWISSIISHYKHIKLCLNLCWNILVPCVYWKSKWCHKNIPNNVHTNPALFIVLVERLISLFGSSKNLWGGRWPQIAYVLWQAYGRWGRSWSFRRWMEGIHPPYRWWKRQTRFPNETRCLGQQWVSQNNKHSMFCSFEGNCVVHSQFPDTYR